MTNSPQFWNRIARKYAKQPVKDEKGYEKTLAAARHYLGPDKNVLELGCGTGSTALKLAADCGELTATDIAAEMIAIAEERKAGAGITNVRFAVGTAHAAELQPGTYDAVLAFNLIHLVDDPHADLRRIRELLKPGGIFISKTACLAEQSRFWPVVAGIMGKVMGVGRIHMWTFAQVEELITAAGFEILEKFPQFPKPPRLFVAARRS